MARLSLATRRASFDLPVPFDAISIMQVPFLDVPAALDLVRPGPVGIFREVRPL